MSRVGSNADSEFNLKPHWELGVDLGIIDFEAQVQKFLEADFITSGVKEFCF